MDSYFIPLDEVFQDTPTYRKCVQKSETDLLLLETTIKKVIALSNKVNDAQTGFNKLFISLNIADVYQKQTDFANEIKKLVNISASPNDTAAEKINVISERIQEVEKSRKIMVVHIKDVFTEPLSNFIIREINPIKILGKEFVLAKDAYESSISRYMAKDLSNSTASALEVSDARKKHHQKALEYCHKLNLFGPKRYIDMLESVTSLFYALFSFHHQGYELFKDLEPMIKSATDSLSKFKVQNSKENVKYDEYFIASKLKPDENYNPLHQLGEGTIFTKETKMQKLTATPIKASYLFKRTVGSLRTTWNRRYFELKNDQLSYFSDVKEQDKCQVDLRICMVRELQTPERKYCFEIISPSKSFVLQTENEFEQKEWISILQGAITRSLQNGSHQRESSSSGDLQTDSGTPDRPEVSTAVPAIQVLGELTKVNGNYMCAECGTKENVEWAVVNMGMLLCITCTGIHRGMGRSISKIRSLELDRWEPSTLEFMKGLGNELSNRIFEGSYNATKSEVKKPTADSSQQDRELWCQKKYISKAFVRKPKDDRLMIENPPQQQFSSAIKESNVFKALKAIAFGADVKLKDLNGQTGLHQAVFRRDIAMADFLLFWNAEIDAVDGNGRTALHLAASNGDINMVILLLKRNANCAVIDKQQKKPQDYALERNQHGDDFVKIVTILRLTLLNRETRNTASYHKNDLGIEEMLADLHSSSPSKQQDQQPPPPTNPYPQQNTYLQQITYTPAPFETLHEPARLSTASLPFGDAGGFGQKKSFEMSRPVDSVASSMAFSLNSVAPPVVLDVDDPWGSVAPPAWGDELGDGKKKRSGSAFTDLNMESGF